MNMTIGIDFDNTIVNYDNIFYKYALLGNLIKPHINKNKKDIRDNIRLLPEGNDRWTELQGLVYGRYMDEAEITEGLDEFLNKCNKMKIKVYIISHKTLYPAMGPKYNLHNAARKWLKTRKFSEKYNISENDAFFVFTLNEKLSMISQRECTYFIDDLSEVLTHPSFPDNVKKILYSKEKENKLPESIIHFKTWSEIGEYLFAD